MKIPQNKNDFFIISRGDWEASIDILFDHKNKINISNLFLILKSYILDTKMPLKFIFIISKENIEGFSINTYHNIKLRKIKFLNLISFTEWFEDIYENDWKYIENVRYYGFRLIFFKDFFIFKEPKYPWDAGFKKELTKDRDFFIKNENTFLKEEIKKLEKRLKELEEK